MKCPRCSHQDDKVIDSRSSKEGDVIRRRRECLKCGHRFTTYERLEEMELIVIKGNQNRQLFDRKKLLAGMVKACEKRPVPLETLEKAVDEIESKLLGKGDREIASREIGAYVMKSLQAIDRIAYVRFASVYRRFEDVEEFISEVQSLDGAAISHPDLFQEPDSYGSHSNS